MTTGAWIGLGYGLGLVLFLRPIFRFCRDDLDNLGGLEDAFELGMCMTMAFVVAWFWPLIAVGLAFKFIVSGRERDPEVIARKLGGESRGQKAKRLEREREDRERYIATLERDLGIG